MHTPDDKLAACGVELQRSDVPDVVALDRRATGIDRAQFLEALIKRSEGTVLRQDSKLAAYALSADLGGAWLSDR